MSGSFQLCHLNTRTHTDTHWIQSFTTDNPSQTQSLLWHSNKLRVVPSLMHISVPHSSL